MDAPPEISPLPAVLLLLLIAAAAVILGIRAARMRWRDPQRLFTWEQKKALIQQAGGRCEHKPPLWFRCEGRAEQADHIWPWSKGGPTELANGQMLCRAHNRAKSNLLPTFLYRWRLKQRRLRY